MGIKRQVWGLWSAYGEMTIQIQSMSKSSVLGVMNPIDICIDRMI